MTYSANGQIDATATAVDVDGHLEQFAVLEF